jgi:hypothetical protein
MKSVLTLLLIGLAQVVMAQETESRNVSSFKGLKVAEGIDVYLKKGEKEALKLEVSGVKPSDVITEVSGDYLKIHMREGRYRDRTVKVYVTYVSLDKLSASSAANIFSESVVKANQLNLSASSAGSIDIQVEAETIEISASSAGDVELQGKVKRLNADVSSAGEIDAYDLTADVVDVEASSGGSAKVNAVKEIIANASSGGSIRFRGNPERSNTNSSSGGSVKKSS